MSDDGAFEFVIDVPQIVRVIGPTCATCPQLGREWNDYECKIDNSALEARHVGRGRFEVLRTAACLAAERKARGQ